MSQYESGIHVMVRDLADWEKLKDYDTFLFRKLFSPFGSEMFSLGSKSFIIGRSEWSCTEDQLEDFVGELAERLNNSCLIYADTSNINVDPYNFFVCYLGGKSVRTKLVEFEFENEVPEKMWDSNYSMADCLNYCVKNKLRFTKENLDYIETFGIKVKTKNKKPYFGESVLNLGLPDSLQLTGTQYEGRIERIENVKEGDSVKLVREPQNEFDPMAIDVRNSEGSLGHLPVYACQVISPLLDKGSIVCSANVCSVTPLSKRSKRCKTAIIEIHVEVSDAEE